MIEICDLVKSFDGFHALDGLNLTVPGGAVYGLCWSNGAGKSTAIRHLAGILRQDSGEVLVEGKEVFENPELKGRIAYIPDEVFFYTQATINDMMKLYQDVFPHFSKERFVKLGAAFEIDPKRLIRKLSKGMQKQAAFWLALSATPDYLLLDEPVDGLDPLMRRQIWSVLLADVAERGTTVLVSSHNLRELEDVCDHVGIVDRGRMLLERSLSDLQENMVKIQAVFRDGQEIPPEVNVLHASSTGRLQQLVIRGKADEVTRKIEDTEPVYMDVIPLTLEEIFIYELGGADHAVKNIIL